MIVGLVAMLAILISRPEVDGLAAGTAKLAAINPNLTDFFSAANFKVLLPNIILTSFGVWGMPQMVHKYYAIKDDRSIKIATVVSTVFALFIGCGAYFNGALSRLFIAADGNGAPDVAGGFDGVVPTMLIKVLGDGLFQNIILGVIMLLLLSASMSTLSSIVLSSSSAVSIDLISDVKSDIKPKSQLFVMRGLCLVFVLLSFVFATMNISFIVNLMSFSWGVVAGSFIGPYIWGLYCKWITKAGAWAGLLAGLVVVGAMLIFNTATIGFTEAKALAPIMGVTSMGVSLVIVPLVSLFTKKYDKKHTDFIFSSTKKAA
jgi:Na+/proline symporter